jgi:predicted RNA polymerase sigma factor
MMRRRHCAGAHIKGTTMKQYLGRSSEAALAYETAIGLCENTAARDFLERRRQSLD